MALRRPLYSPAPNELQPQDDAALELHHHWAIYEYAESPSQELHTTQQSGGGAAIGTMTDTRLQAGTGTTDARNFDTEAELEDVSVVSTVYETLWPYANFSSDKAGIVPSRGENLSYPVYLDADNNVRAMTQEDFLDTFIRPALNIMGAADGTDYADYFLLQGTYLIVTTADGNPTPSIVLSQNVTGNYQMVLRAVDLSPIFVDSVADIDAYTAAGLIEDRDQPDADLATNYYLFKIDSYAPPTSYTAPYYIDDDGNLQQYTNAEWQALLGDHIRWAAVADDNGNRMRYYVSGGENGVYSGGSSMGESMVDQQYDSSAYLTRRVNANDYRAQEVPAGTLQVNQTYILKMFA